jgi:hypothetical protein
MYLMYELATGMAAGTDLLFNICLCLCLFLFQFRPGDPIPAAIPVAISRITYRKIFLKLQLLVGEFQRYFRLKHSDSLSHFLRFHDKSVGNNTFVSTLTNYYLVYIYLGGSCDQLI